MGKFDKNFRAFTVKFDGRASSLTTKIGISLPYKPPDDTPPPNPVEFKAIWDTGASMSTITKSAAEKLHLSPTGKVGVNNTSGKETKDTYLVNIYLPNRVILPYIRVVECKSLVGDFEFLVGMDVISNGDFSITNVDGKTVMTYRIPSIDEIDYVREAQILKANRELFGRVEDQKEKRLMNASRSKISRRRKKEKLKRKARSKNRKKK